MPDATKTSISSAAFTLIFLLGTVHHAAPVSRAVDQAIWRESDMAAIARNFYREGMNPLYPRIDWRGDGPGFVEMEAPFLPWIMAVLYSIFGMDATIGRWVSLTASLGTIAVFLLLARDRIPPVGAAVAAVFFVINPLLARMATSLRPEAIMMFGYVAAVCFLTRWLQSGARRDYVIALVATACAMLAKLPAAHIGLVFATLILWTKGLGALRDWRVWLFAVASLLPGVLWYLHAHSFWLTYGNSMGISNQDNLILFHSQGIAASVRGVVRTELQSVWTPAGFGLISLLLLVRRPWRRLKLELCWLAGLGVFLLMAAPTAGKGWAAHYHVVVIPVACLLIGSAAQCFWEAPANRRSLGALSLVAIILGVVLGALSLGSGPAFRIAAGALVFGVLCGLRARFATNGAKTPSLLRYAVVVLAILLFSGAGLFQLRRVRCQLQSLGILVEREPSPRYECAQEFRGQVPPGELVLATGGRCLDETGRRVAPDKPYMFYWMDRKGFIICREEQTLAVVDRAVARGATFFVAELINPELTPGFEEELRRVFPVVKECETAILFEIRPR